MTLKNFLSRKAATLIPSSHKRVVGRRGSNSFWTMLQKKKAITNPGYLVLLKKKKDWLEVWLITVHPRLSKTRIKVKIVAEVRLVSHGCTTTTH